MLSLATPAGAERCGDGVEVTDAGASPSMNCGRVVARDGGGILSDTESGSAAHGWWMGLWGFVNSPPVIARARRFKPDRTSVRPLY